MNSKVKSILTNFSYTMISNLVSMVISAIVVMIVPKLISVNDYGYWQLYIFYSSYVGFFNIGWVEGIYLRFGGKEYNELDRNIFASQFWSFITFIAFSGGLIIIYSLFYVIDYNRQFIYRMISICLVLTVSRGFLLYILQLTNRIREFSKLTLLDRVIYCIIIIGMISIGVREFRYLIIADLISKAVTLIGAVFFCKEIVFSKLIALNAIFKEIIINISIGIKLMLANIASILITGVVRFGIERSWDVATFGRISLTLSVSNLLMIFINAIGIIMFPVLRRIDENKLPGIYETVRNFLTTFLLGTLVLYYPFKVVLSGWLPKYSDSLKYLAILFPICVFEGRMALLINTYLNTMRKEKVMLKVNLISLALSIVIATITTMIIKNLELAMLSIVIVLAFRCTLAEIYLSKYLNISVRKDIFLELIMTFLFVTAGWFLNSWIAGVLYIGAYSVYLITKQKDIKITVKNVKAIMSS